MPRRDARGAGSRERRRLEPLCIGHRLDDESSTDISRTHPLDQCDRLARSTRCPAPTRQVEPFNLSRPMMTNTQRSSRFGRPTIASRLQELMHWQLVPTDGIVGVWIPPTEELVRASAHK